MTQDARNPAPMAGTGLRNGVQLGGVEHQETTPKAPPAQVSVYRDHMRPLARRGSKSTAVAAAIDATKKAPSMVDRIWSLLQDGPLTPEEAHAKLEAEDDARVLLTSVRARMCSLHKAGLVVDSGERGIGESRRSKVVRWRVTTPEEREAHAAAIQEAAQ